MDFDPPNQRTNNQIPNKVKEESLPGFEAEDPGGDAEEGGCEAAEGAEGGGVVGYGGGDGGGDCVGEDGVGVHFWGGGWEEELSV